MSLRQSILVTAALSCLTAAAPALAQDAPASEDRAPSLPVDPAAINSDDTITVGGGAGFVPSYDGSDDYVFVPAAAIRGKVSGFNFFSRGTQLYIDLIPNRGNWNVELGPVVGANFNRTARIVDPQVRALGKRKFAIEGGGFAGISKTGVITSDYDTLGVRVTFLHDITNVHDSYVIQPSIDYGTPLSRKIYVGISGSATIVGDDYARTYFAVDPAGAARSGLPVFANPKGGLKNYTVTGLLAYSLTGDLTHGLQIFATGSYSRLQGDFARSPVVSVAGDANQWFGAAGIGYTF